MIKTIDVTVDSTLEGIQSSDITNEAVSDDSRNDFIDSLINQEGTNDVVATENQTEFTLASEPVIEDGLIVVRNNNAINKDLYSVSGTTVTLLFNASEGDVFSFIYV